MKIPIVSIGNSRGIRIPSPILQQCEMGREVDLEVRDGAIIIKRSMQSGFWKDLDHIDEVDDMSVQLVLRECEAGTLALALVGAAASVKEKIFSNMSERAKTMLAEKIRLLEAADAKALIVEMNKAKIDGIINTVLN